jgi:predicted transcriptional regulator
MATTNTEINDAIKLSVEVAKSYASSGQANPEIIPDLIEKVYRKLISLYEGKC